MSKTRVSKMSSVSAAYSQQQLQKAIEWFVQLQDEACAAGQQAGFEQWLAKHPNHIAAYAEAERIWQGLDTIKTLALLGLTEARAVKPKTWRRSASATGLSLLLGVLLTGAYLEYSAETIHYATRMGERRSIELADHSQLALNTNTQVAIKISSLGREVTLTQGEALFTVQHERLRSFTVKVGALQIRDIGTRFNVKLQPEGTTIAVLEGEVELNDAHRVKHKTLAAGRQVVYQTNSGLVQDKALETDKVTAWQNSHLIFKRSPLSEVAAELERYHPVNFVFADPALANETISGTFNSGDLKPFLHALESILPIKAKRKGQQIVLLRAH
ncbi:MAG: FecR domain-containing protein [Methylococcales bacterium]